MIFVSVWSVHCWLYFMAQTFLPVYFFFSSFSMLCYRLLQPILTLYYRLYSIILDIYKGTFPIWALIQYLFSDYIKCCICLFCSSVWFSIVVNVWCCRNWRFVFVVWFAMQGESNETRIAVANQRAHDLLK